MGARRRMAEPIEVNCEDCSTTTAYPSTAAGTMQMCPQCASYLDVPDGTEDEDDWWNVEESDGTEEGDATADSSGEVATDDDTASNGSV